MLNRKFLSFALLPSLFMISCGGHDLADVATCSSSDCIAGESELISRTGWLVGRENLNNIPQDISVSNVSSGDLPNKISLKNIFPPIGNQGQYGTCVAWAAGYNLKTALNAIENGWSGTDLLKTANQTSPKDLWLVIDHSQKDPNCNGTSFESALDALIQRGAANLSSVPYANMGNCSGSSIGNADNKLANYRKIAYNYGLAGGSGSLGLTLDNFKGYLAQGRPILFGAKLGDRFMRWNNTSVISSDTYNDPSMQHAYHAMVLVGYDDSREAFEVRNSWGESWGDKGSVWVDYNFFLRNFMFVAFVAQNQTTQVTPDQSLTGYDLLASYAMDEPNPKGTSPRDRKIDYEVYNSGTNPILAKQRWSVLYMYYNAFNANEYGIILEDHYTDEYGKPGDYGNDWNNIDLKPRESIRFNITYTMPATITGKYFLVVYADAYDAIRESNEDNNFYFIGTEGGKPLDFVNGVMQNKPAKPTALAKTAVKAAVKAAAKSVQEIGGSANAYTPEEIRSLVSQSKKSGALAKKISQHRESNDKLLKLRKDNP